MRKARLAIVGLMAATVMLMTACQPAPTYNESQKARTALSQAGLRPTGCTRLKDPPKIHCKMKYGKGFYSSKIQRNKTRTLVQMRRQAGSTHAQAFDYFTFTLNSRGRLSSWRYNPA